MEKLKFVTFNTNNTYGNTNGGAGKANRLKIAEEVGFDLNRLFFTNQPDVAVKGGSCYTVTKEDLQNWENLYAYEVDAHTAKITPDTPGVAIGFNLSGGANIVAMNTKTMEATSTFCKVQNIDARIPETIASATGGNPEDIIVVTSPFEHITPKYNEDKNWRPDWHKDNGVWDDAYYVDPDTNIIYYNQLKALKNQLLSSGIKEQNIIWGEDSLYKTDSNGNFVYPSSTRTYLLPDLENPGKFIIDSETGTYLKDRSQDGRFMQGVVLLEETKEPYANKDIKVYSYGSTRRR